MAKKSKKQKLEDDRFLQQEMDISLEAIDHYHKRVITCKDELLKQALQSQEYYFILRYEALKEGRMTI